MLLWRPNERSKYFFFCELLIISSIAHLVIGILLFMVYRTGISTYRIELGHVQTPTLFMPLKRQSTSAHLSQGPHAKKDYRGTGKEGHTIENLASTMHQGGSVSQHKRRLGSNTTMGLDDHTVSNQKNNSSKKHVPDTSKHSKLAKKEQAKKEVRKNLVTKQVTNTSSSADECLSITPKDIITPKVQPVATEAKKTDHVLPKTLPAQQETPLHKIAAEPVAQNQEMTEPDVHEPVFGQEIPDDQIIVGVGETADESMSAEQARIYQCIEQEIVSRWKPPRGLSKDLVCHIKCCVGGNGTVISCHAAKSSGVLVYDMAARSAARGMNLPRWAWGKEFTIVFKQ